jgi:hypothetical protein
MYKIEYNLILKLFITLIIIYSLLKIVPVEDISNKDLVLIIFINLLSFYLINLL